MPGAYCQLLLHVVFSTKDRRPWITPEVAARLYPYVGGVVRARGGVLYDVSGSADHLHMYLRWRADGSVSDLMRTVKASSSRWMRDTFPALATFAWQAGYSVFSVSRSREAHVKGYIAGQTEHHKKEGFESELLRLLRAHGVEYDPQHVLG
jgi:REP element-mobilizing transposase RayT